MRLRKPKAISSRGAREGIGWREKPGHDLNLAGVAGRLGAVRRLSREQIESNAEAWVKAAVSEEQLDAEGRVLLEANPPPWLAANLIAVTFPYLLEAYGAKGGGASPEVSKNVEQLAGPLCEALCKRLAINNPYREFAKMTITNAYIAMRQYICGRDLVHGLPPSDTGGFHTTARYYVQLNGPNADQRLLADEWHRVFRSFAYCWLKQNAADFRPLRALEFLLGESEHDDHFLASEIDIAFGRDDLGRVETLTTDPGILNFRTTDGKPLLYAAPRGRQDADPEEWRLALITGEVLAQNKWETAETPLQYLSKATWAQVRGTEYDRESIKAARAGMRRGYLDAHGNVLRDRLTDTGKTPAVLARCMANSREARIDRTTRVSEASFNAALRKLAEGFPNEDRDIVAAHVLGMTEWRDIPERLHVDPKHVESVRRKWNSALKLPSAKRIMGCLRYTNPSSSVFYYKERLGPVDAYSGLWVYQHTSLDDKFPAEQGEGTQRPALKIAPFRK